MLGESMKYVAAVAGSLQYTIEETSAMLGVLANSGLKASMAGTTLRSILLQTSTVAEKLGIAGATTSEMFKEMAKRQMDATEVQKLFGRIATTGALVLMNNVEAYDLLLTKIEMNQGATERLAAIIRDSLGNAIKGLNSALESVKLDIFEKFKPLLKKTTAQITVFVRENKLSLIELVEDGVIFLIDSFGSLVKAVGVAAKVFPALHTVALIALEGIGTAIGLAAKALKGLMIPLNAIFVGLEALGVIEKNPFDKLIDSTTDFKMAMREAKEASIAELMQIDGKWKSIDKTVQGYINSLKSSIIEVRNQKQEMFIDDDWAHWAEDWRAESEASTKQFVGDLGDGWDSVEDQAKKSAENTSNAWMDAFDNVENHMVDFFDFMSDSFLDLNDLSKSITSDMSRALSKDISGGIMDMFRGGSSIFGGSSSSGLTFGGGSSVGGMGDWIGSAFNAASGQTGGSINSALSWVGGLFGAGGVGGAVGTGSTLSPALTTAIGKIASGVGGAGAGGVVGATTPGGVGAVGGSVGASGSGFSAGGAGAAAIWAAAFMALGNWAQGQNEKSGRNMVRTGAFEYTGVGWAGPGQLTDPLGELVSGKLYGDDARHSPSAYASAAFNKGDWVEMGHAMFGMFLGGAGDQLFNNQVTKLLDLGNVKRSYLGLTQTGDYDPISKQFEMTGSSVWKDKRQGEELFRKPLEGLGQDLVRQLNVVSESLNPLFENMGEEWVAQFEQIKGDLGFDEGYGKGRIEWRTHVGAEDEGEWEDFFDHYKDKVNDKIRDFSKESVDLYILGMRDALDNADLSAATDILSAEALAGITASMEIAFGLMAIGGKGIKKEFEEIQVASEQLQGMILYIERLNLLYSETQYSLDQLINPMTEFESAINNINVQVNEAINQLAEMGMAEEKLLEINEKRNDIIDQITQSYVEGAVTGILEEIIQVQNQASSNFAEMLEDISFQTSGKSRQEYLKAQIGTAMTGGDVLAVSVLAQEWYQVAVSAAVSAAEDSAKIQTEAASEIAEKLTATAESWERVDSIIDNLVSGFDQTIRNIEFSGLNVGTPSQRITTAQSTYSSLFKEAKQEQTPEAFRDFTSFVSTYLAEYQARWKSSETYQQEYASSIVDIKSLKDLVGGREFEQKQFDLQYKERMLTSTEMAQVDLSGIFSQIETWNTWMENYNAQSLQNLEINNENLNAIFELLKEQKFNFTIIVAGEEFHGDVEKIAEDVFVRATRREERILSTVS